MALASGSCVPGRLLPLLRSACFALLRWTVASLPVLPVCSAARCQPVRLASASACSTSSFPNSLLVACSAVFFIPRYRVLNRTHASMLSVFSLCVFLICLRTVVVLLGSAFPTPITTAIHAGSCPAAGAIYCGGSLLPIGFYSGRCLPVCFFDIQFLGMMHTHRSVFLVSVACTGQV